MRRTPSPRSTRHSLEREVAPHVEPEWAEAMLLELRGRGIAGPRIGAALAEVDSHCAESGQTAEESFGDPAAYARRLELPAEDDVSPRALIRSAVPTLVQVLGMLLLLPSFAAWREDTAMEVTAGMLVSLGLLLLLLTAAVRGVDLVLRTVVRRPVVAWVAGLAPLVLFVAAQLLLPAVALRAPAAWAMVLAVVLLVAGTAWSAARQRPDQADAVVAPLATSGSRPGVPVLARVLTVGLIPIATAGFLALSWWMTR